MWYGLFLIIAAVIAAALTVVSAGAFTIVLVVVAVIAFSGGGFVLWAARAAGLKALTDADAGASADITREGGASEAGPGRVPATPEELLQARQAAQ